MTHIDFRNGFFEGNLLDGQMKLGHQKQPGIKNKLR